MGEKGPQKMHDIEGVLLLSGAGPSARLVPSTTQQIRPALLWESGRHLCCTPGLCDVQETRCKVARVPCTLGSWWSMKGT